MILAGRIVIYLGSDVSGKLSRPLPQKHCTSGGLVDRARQAGIRMPVPYFILDYAGP